MYLTKGPLLLSSTAQLTNFVVNLDLVHQKLLKLANLHDLVLHRLLAVNYEA